jgi:hypothetical protein
MQAMDENDAWAVQERFLWPQLGTEGNDQVRPAGAGVNQV